MDRVITPRRERRGFYGSVAQRIVIPMRECLEQRLDLGL